MGQLLEIFLLIIETTVQNILKIFQHDNTNFELSHDNTKFELSC